MPPFKSIGDWHEWKIIGDELSKIQDKSIKNVQINSPIFDNQWALTIIKWSHEDDVVDEDQGLQITMSSILSPFEINRMDFEIELECKHYDKNKLCHVGIDDNIYQSDLVGLTLKDIAQDTSLDFKVRIKLTKLYDDSNEMVQKEVD